MSRRSRRGRARGTRERGSQRVCMKDMMVETVCVRKERKEEESAELGGH